MKLILTDIDEVILKWQDSFYVWFLKNKIKNNNIITKLGIRPDFDQWIDIYPDNFNDTIITFNKSESFGKLIPYDSALVELPILKNLGYKFIGITACGVDVTTKTLRRNNLEYYFPGIFEEIHFSKCILFDGGLMIDQNILILGIILDIIVYYIHKIIIYLVKILDSPE